MVALTWAAWTSCFSANSDIGMPRASFTALGIESPTSRNFLTFSIGSPIVRSDVHSLTPYKATLSTTQCQESGFRSGGERLSDGQGEQIRRFRRRLELSQAQLAQKLGVSRVTVADWERGAAEPHDQNLKKLAALFGVTPGDLRYGTAIPSRMAVREGSGSTQWPATRRLPPAVYEVVYGYLDRMRKGGCSEEQINEAERLMTDASYSQLYARSRREKTEDDQIMDIHAAWRFIAEVIERTEGKRL